MIELRALGALREYFPPELQGTSSIKANKTTCYTSYYAKQIMLIFYQKGILLLISNFVNKIQTAGRWY